ncbi:aryl-alcohol dehydrogenase-like predicted oxidoreductase [Allocatelliglobosispora scoriae]|uniref:Aryl-alcohol dehydrogenase-like predicted oxidoreductase n=1 Tax=Allocatelliglobosispora scoriae TaxID=643052 RepID=A0A841BM51_9ACTN|nr:aldo/keto reductase [Allocatelliglobosispora scoriae]MBB5868336.1 aryl-alcohol dehydrogenase-like predicted oxidoreductase [Allocatelliglobosispora scoriae]
MTAEPFPELGPLGLGTWLFGWETPVEEAHRLMRRALDEGITYFDTANNYGSGASEEIVGAYLRPMRDRILIGTKVYAPFGPDPADRGLSAQAVRRAVAGCLERLGTDYLDVLHLHRPDPTVPAEETAGALADLVRAGTVRHIATSTFHGHQIDALQQALRAEGIAPAGVDQAPYSLLERQVESAAGDALREWRMGITAWSPLGEGLLTGKYADAAAEGRIRRWNAAGEERYQRGFEAAERFGKLASANGWTLPQLALGWLARRPLVGSILIGARTLEQFDTYLDGVATPVDGVDEAVDEIVGPGQSLLHHYRT